MGIPEHPLGERGGNGEWKKINKKGWGKEVGLHRAPGYAGEVVIGVEVSYLHVRDLAFKISLARKRFGCSPMRWELCTDTYIFPGEKQQLWLR